jgi:hypothetical protein
MLIQYLGGALATFLVELALGLGSSKPRAIGLGLAAGLFALNALPEPLEINYFPHIRIPVRRKSERDDNLRKARVVRKAVLRSDGTAMANSFIFKSPPQIAT